MSGTSTNITSLTGPSFTKDLQGWGLLKRRWVYHLLFWLAYYMLMIILYMSLHENLNLDSHLMYLVFLIFQALFAYFNIYVLIPLLLFARNYIYYWFALFVNITFCSVIVTLIRIFSHLLKQTITIPFFP